MNRKIVDVDRVSMRTGLVCGITNRDFAGCPLVYYGSVHAGPHKLWYSYYATRLVPECPKYGQHVRVSQLAG